MPDRHPDGRILVEPDGHILRMGVDRPDKRNAFTPKMFLELGQAYSQLEASDDLRVGVLYGVGDHFTAGIDLGQMAEHRAAGRPYAPLNLIDPLHTRAPFRSKPVICAVKGVCFTIGLELMMAADIVIAAANCRFAQMEVSRGVMPGCGGTYRLVERAGWGDAMRWLLTGDEFDVGEARRMGLVQDVTAVGDELERALELAACVARQAPLALRAVMANAQLALGPQWMMAATQASAVNTGLFATEDAAEGRRALAERRPAIFRGR